MGACFFWRPQKPKKNALLFITFLHVLNQKKPSFHFFLPKTLPHMPKKSNASTNRKKMKKTDDSSIYEDEAIPCLFLLLKRKKYCGKKALKNSKCKIDLQSLFFLFSLNPKKVISIHQIVTVWCIWLRHLSSQVTSNFIFFLPHFFYCIFYFQNYILQGFLRTKRYKF